jgi:hypothetical protein
MDDAGPADVLFELLRYGEGSFTFEAGTAPEAPTPARAVEPLLVDVERQLVEWREIEAVVPSMDAWVSLEPELAAEEIAVAAERWKVIVAIGSGTSVTGVGLTLQQGELPLCRQIKELVELGLAKVSTTPMPALRAVEAALLADPAAIGSVTDGGAEAADSGTGASWDPFSIEIPGVEPVGVSEDTVVEAAADEVVSVVEDDEIEADEVAMQLASLSPKAARAVAAASKAATTEERDAALAEAGDDDEPINRGLLLKFLSSVKS